LVCPSGFQQNENRRVQGELSHLVSAIELYKDRYKVYPPDTQMKDANGTLCRLFGYQSAVLELTGCLVTNNAFSSPYIRTPRGISIY
jgi:hypothetical protein